MAEKGESNAYTMLNQNFTYWFTFFKKSKDKQLEEFEDNLKPIGTFNTAEDFWSIYEHMKRPSALPRGCEFFLFKEGIKPLWEDKQNIGGGRFYLSMKKSPVTNKIWEDLQIAFILTDASLNDVNGIVLNVRTAEVFMSIWTKRINTEQITKIKEWIRDSLDLPNEQVIEFKPHPNNEQLIQKQEHLIKEEEDRKKKEQDQEKRKLEEDERKRTKSEAERLQNPNFAEHAKQTENSPQKSPHNNKPEEKAIAS